MFWRLVGVLCPRRAIGEEFFFFRAAKTYQDIVDGAVQIFGLEQSTVIRGAAAGK